MRCSNLQPLTAAKFHGIVKPQSREAWHIAALRSAATSTTCALTTTLIEAAGVSASTGRSTQSVPRPVRSMSTRSRWTKGRRSCRASTRSRSGLTTGTIILSCRRSRKRRHTVIKHHNLLTNTLNAAERQEYITKNPMRAVSPPKKRQHESKFYTPEQLGVLLAKAVGTRLELPVYICACLGLRRGELCGLR